MSPAAASSRLNPHLSVPGKVFIVGEYLALSGFPALLLAVPPRFGFSSVVSKPVFHPNEASPLGLLLAAMGMDGLPAEVQDPWRGRGGFGASTAEFLLGYRWLRETGRLAKSDGFEAWRLYRELCVSTSEEGRFAPSGADLIIQERGGLGLFSRCSENEPHFEDLSLKLPGLDFVVFSATRKPGRKTPTHAHLTKISSTRVLDEGFPLLGRLREACDRAVAAVHASDAIALGLEMMEYAEILGDVDLEHAEARLERERLSNVPGVAGVKGAGALLSDAIVAVLAPGTETERSIARKKLETEAIALGLEPVAGAGQCEPGLRTEAKHE